VFYSFIVLHILFSPSAVDVRCYNKPPASSSLPAAAAAAAAASRQCNSLSTLATKVAENGDKLSPETATNVAGNSDF